ncbi:hypothetical protein [Clostridium sp. BNL1100]|uniref:hypothetical protein n=1 Tax=Clostridium sp. BNL1100 TaxID=755731 RepID=UPI00024A7A90|nr:hypothetical protein [Clostridium sp. BNL1100]AEY66600.1 hypothetical protein Clo1100_2429 [Clostridium sp. BNL1100]
MQEENFIITIWDRVSPINGLSATEIISYRQDIANEPTVLLFSDPNTWSVNMIEFPHTLIDTLNRHDVFKPVDTTLDPIEIGHLYLQYLYLMNHPVLPKTELQILQEKVDSCIVDVNNLIEIVIDKLI